MAGDYFGVVRSGEDVSILVYPCKATKGEHRWERGLDDHWWCPQCALPLYVDALIAAERAQRKRADKLWAELDRSVDPK